MTNPMVTFDFTQPYPNLTGLLLLLTGILLLLVDVKAYNQRSMSREAQWTRRLGWTNIACGVAMYVAGWVYSQWIW